MERLPILFAAIILTLVGYSQVKISTDSANPHGSAGLDVDFDNKGFLPPRMTTEERNAIALPAEGLMIYNTDLKCIQYNIGTSVNPNWICSDGRIRGCGTGSVTFSYKGQSVTYNTVERDYGNGNIKCWLDRNLGATQVATSSTDANSYGDLFQWGRRDDGHQVRTSNTTTSLSTSDQPSNGNFITSTTTPYDWRSPQTANLWQGAINNPCPNGWRLPTESEFNVERSSWINNNAAGAFASPLKLPMGGERASAGGLFNVGVFGIYWTSDVSDIYSVSLDFQVNDAYMYALRRRNNGASVRCIKD